MATDVPQRDLRNKTAELLRRVEGGERLRITVHGHPVAELGPIATTVTFVPKEQLIEELGGLLTRGDRLDEELRDGDAEIVNPFE